MTSERSLPITSAKGSSLTALLPKTITTRLELFQDDVRMVVAGLSGRTPPPFTRREPLARHLLATPAQSMLELLATRKLRVARVTRETPDAVSLHLVDAMGR